LKMSELLSERVFLSYGGRKTLPKKVRKCMEHGGNQGRRLKNRHLGSNFFNSDTTSV